MRIAWIAGILAVTAVGLPTVGCTRMAERPRAAVEAAGCGRRAPEPGDHEREIVSGGRRRSFVVHVPPGYTGNTPTPVVLNFHGGGGNASDQQRISGMDAVADRHRFLVVYPNGTGPTRERFLSFNAGMCCGYAKARGVDDVRFVVDLLTDLQRNFCIDPKRVYATGFSNGAILSHRLGCELAGRIAAIAPVAGPIGVDRCEPARPVPVLYFHGTADPFAPYEGGPRKALASQELLEYRSAPETFRGWANRNGCQGSSQVRLRRGAVTCETHEQCAQGTAVTLCTIRGGGHTWPGGQSSLPERMVGPVNRDVSASEMIWEFFARYALP